ncbi:hypothetical protein [Catellatospora citrea]|uniref:Uncharacterized protein n=1 Tax=Catellatospora citrea TaxID=53366 RepID=A0A8J3NXX2_9ACTN|nr:hypothetical protein [Catellatospora citrea]RKE05545.1 hypothetical protein C8E86_0348 [Catellatospora citrea]GIF96895.1 hypothetical protein Cci01nite_19890 [Catellatospora citrea]
MAGAQRSQRRLTNGWRLVAVCGVIMAGFGLIYGSHWLLNPWAMPGRPGLVGYWQGEVTYGAGDTRTMVLRLTDQVGSGDGGPEIDGSAKVCAAEQDATYEIYGDTLNYRGTRYSLHARRPDNTAGLYLGQLDGEWDGRDGLTISTALIRVDPDGAVRSTTSTDTRTGTTTSDTITVRFELRRATAADFDAACDA